MSEKIEIRVEARNYLEGEPVATWQANPRNNEGVWAMKTARIAIVQSLDGHLTCCGPADFEEKAHSSAMEAALSWHLEAGHLPGASYWVEVELPPLPTIPELRAKAEASELPKYLAEDD